MVNKVHPGFITVHADGPFALMAIGEQMYWVDIQMKKIELVVLPTTTANTVVELPRLVGGD